MDVKRERARWISGLYEVGYQQAIFKKYNKMLIIDMTANKNSPQINKFI